MNWSDFYKSLFLLGFFSIQTNAGEGVKIATWGSVEQSSTHSDWYAQKALDGVKSTCTHTDLESNAWWKLDLMKAYNVNRVTITNRNGCCSDRINGAEIRIGNNSSNVFSNPVCAVVSTIPEGATYSYPCYGMKGRYVSVDLPGPTAQHLTLCEVEVYEEDLCEDET
ncbi:fucolectin-like isoform X2 [Carassius auratus]|uniref:Fucolectin-like isoform X2 n=1 Tax=Carassius auratus TaxID=7957 RepID=A0A6P6MRW0_CARAU|nr:fucolectin-like isoform X2 [Carassius auratus]